MMRLSRITIIAAILSIFTQQLFAQSVESPMTLEACIQVALQNNPASNYAKQSELSALEDVRMAKGRYYPEVGWRFGYRRWESHIFLPSGFLRPGLDTIGPVNEWRTNLRAQYTIFDSGLRSSELNSAESQYAVSQEQSLETRNNIIYSVHAAYYDVLAAEDELELSKTRVSRSHDHLRIASDRKEAGDVPQADVTRARVDLSSAELNAVSAEGSLRIALGNLNQAMGRMPQEPLQIAHSEIGIPDPAATDVNQFLSTALQKRPEILAAQRSVDAKRSQIGIAKSDILPKVRAEAGYGWLDDDFWPEDQDWWVGITLDIPLLDGGTRRHRIAKSKVEVSREQAQLDQLKLSVQQEVWSAYSRWIEAHQSLETSGTRQAEAEESLRLTKARYEEGAGTINDLLDAELSMDQAETGLNTARYRLYLARIVFLLATGEL
ncbi:TolC family protein [bacterium]|nr:TolC family protein [bacterium]